MTPLISGPPDCLADSDGAGAALAAFDGHGGSQCEEGISYRPGTAGLGGSMRKQGI